jgi:AcrR family transcriptional regulator
MPESALASTEDQIVEAANRCFHRFGLRRTTVEDVAREARVSRGSVYRYFKDKDSLVQTVMVRNAAVFFEEVRRKLDAQPTFEDKLAEAAVLAIGYRRTDPVYAGLAATEPETLAILLTTQSEQFMRMSTDFLLPYIAQAKRAGELRKELNDPRAAEWCVRIIMSLITTSSLVIDVNEPAQIRRFVRDHLVRGLR